MGAVFPLSDDFHVNDEVRNLRDVRQIVAVLPERLRSLPVLQGRRHLAGVEEFVVDIGKPAKVRFSDSARDVALDPAPVTVDDIREVFANVAGAKASRPLHRRPRTSDGPPAGDAPDPFRADNRAGIDGSLHRISVLRNTLGDPVGFTLRVGRSVKGSSVLVTREIRQGRSMLLVGRPGSGKTTALREIARALAAMGRRVVIVDTSNEIGGDGDVPHPAVGDARRIQVKQRTDQAHVMIEAVQNHNPEVIVIDEIGTSAEAAAASTIAERGVQLIATAHGHTLANVVRNKPLNHLMGGVNTVILSAREAKGGPKTRVERTRDPTFQLVVEIITREAWRVHEDVAGAVTKVLLGDEPDYDVRELSTPVHALDPDSVGVPITRTWGRAGRERLRELLEERDREREA